MLKKINFLIILIGLVSFLGCKGTGGSNNLDASSYVSGPVVSTESFSLESEIPLLVDTPIVVPGTENTIISTTANPQLEEENVHVNPEPNTIILLGLSILGMFFSLKRR